MLRDARSSRWTALVHDGGKGKVTFVLRGQSALIMVIEYKMSIPFLRIRLEELKKKKKKIDTWSVFANIDNYLKYPAFLLKKKNIPRNNFGQIDRINKIDTVL